MTITTGGDVVDGNGDGAGGVIGLVERYLTEWKRDHEALEKRPKR